MKQRKIGSLVYRIGKSHPLHMGPPCSAKKNIAEPLLMFQGATEVALQKRPPSVLKDGSHDVS